MGVRPNELLTIGEAVETIRRLDERRGLTVSARQLRYWDTTMLLGAKRAGRGRNAARIFSPADLAVARLIRRLQRDGVSRRAIWALLTHLGTELRAACRPGTSRVLWLEPTGRACLLSAREAAVHPPRECYVLANVVRGIDETIRAVRSGDYLVWNGAKAVAIDDLTEP